MLSVNWVASFTPSPSPATPPEADEGEGTPVVGLTFQAALTPASPSERDRG